MGKEFTVIATHKGPHLDEIAGIYLLRREGERFFPGVSTARLEFWGEGGTPDGASAEAWEHRGVLALGVGGGRFDEHPTIGQRRKHGEHAVTLVAKAVGADENPLYKRVIEYSLAADRGERMYLFELAQMITLAHLSQDSLIVTAWALEAIDAVVNAEIHGHAKEGRSKTPPDNVCAAMINKWIARIGDKGRGLNKVFSYRSRCQKGKIDKDNPFEFANIVDAMCNAVGEQRTQQWVSFGLEAVYQAQMEFLRAEHDLKNTEKALVQKFKSAAGGGELTLCVAITNNKKFIAYARSKLGVSADIVVLQQPSGRTQIFTLGCRTTASDDLARALRIEERIHSGAGQTDPTQWDKMVGEGKFPGAEVWYYFAAMGSLFNGSLTARDVPPTKIPLERIAELVIMAFGDYFEPSRSEKCFKGICTSKAENPCPWYRYGISRCRAAHRDWPNRG